MCLSNLASFPNLNVENFFRHCDSMCYSNAPYGNNLITYLAWSSNKNFNADLCLMQMTNRATVDDTAQTYFNFNPWESHIFKRRFKLLSSNNKSYNIATKRNPTVQDLEEFSEIDPCFATLYPVKMYLSNHLEMAPEYHGMLPFGKEVTRYYNTLVPAELEIKGSPSFKDHVSLRLLSNKKAILMGVPTITINNLMYQSGRALNDSDTTSDDGTDD